MAKRSADYQLGKDNYNEQATSAVLFSIIITF